MYWQRFILAVAILAISAAMFLPLPRWAAIILITIAFIAALSVIAQQFRARR